MPEIRPDLEEIGKEYLTVRRLSFAGGVPRSFSPSELGEIVNMIGTRGEADRRGVMRAVMAADRAWVSWALEEMAKRGASGPAEDGV